jgi:hypothetical protein
MTASQLDFGAGYGIGSALRSFKRALADIVDAVGLQVAADRVGTQKAQLRQAVDGAESRYVAIDHVLPLLAMAPREVIVKALDQWLAPLGLKTAPVKERTPAEKLADLRERVLAELGTAGARLVAEEENRP